MKPNTRQTGPPELITAIFLRDNMYFVDLRRHQFRGHDDPERVIPFHSAKGKALCRRCSIRVCSVGFCRTAVMAPIRLRTQRIFCPQCRADIPPEQL